VESSAQWRRISTLKLRENAAKRLCEENPAPEKKNCAKPSENIDLSRRTVGLSSGENDGEERQGLTA